MSLKHLDIAIVGNPNVGKSSLVNALAGTRLYVGNWPGVTVEKKQAAISYKDTTFNLVDLPGMYSLHSYTQEETIARNYLLHDVPDIIVQVIDSTNLERNLYLTEDGKALERQLSDAQRKRMRAAYRAAGSDAVQGFRLVLEKIMDVETRNRITQDKE